MSKLPREEMSYKTLYPDLSRYTELPVINKIYKPVNSEPKLRRNNNTDKTLQKDDLNNIDYCINEQDQDFVKRYLKNNPEFCKKYEGVAIELYELILDRITKEWRYTQLRMLKNYYKKNNTNNEKTAIENKKCDICTTDQSTESNVILQCNGCNIMVHQECYGTPNLEKCTEIENVANKLYFVNLLWFCRKCLFFRDLTPKCKYCPISGNAYKPIYGTKRWAHVLCAMFIKTLHFSNLLFLEPIEEQNIESKSTKDHSLDICNICTSKKGRFAKCNYKTCNETYHVTCGINTGYYFDVKNCVTYCFEHNPMSAKINNKIDNDSYTNLLELNYEKTKTGNYEKIKSKPVIRKKEKIKELKESFIFTVKNMKPRFTDYYANRIFASDLCQFNDKLIFSYLYEIGHYWNVKTNRFYDPGDFLSMKDSDWKEWNQKRSIWCCNTNKTITNKLDAFNNTKTHKNNLKDNKKHYKMFLETIAKKYKYEHVKELYYSDYLFFSNNLIEIRKLIEFLKTRKVLKQKEYVIGMQIHRLKNDK
ncbi:hypothetical protein BDAP_000156 [Binucleata daphniae]